jgi:hypothetical protein
VEEAAGILSLHYLVAGDNRSAWRHATIAGKRAAGVYAYIEAARLYARALEAGAASTMSLRENLPTCTGLSETRGIRRPSSRRRQTRMRLRASW